MPAAGTIKDGAMRHKYFFILFICFIFLLEGSLFAEESEVAEEEKPKLWQGAISLGYNKTSGNTNTSALSAGFFADRKSDKDEVNLKATLSYSSSDKKMDTQKWYTMSRYAYSFWKKKWYNFYKLELDHDRFANIDYRILPSMGVGYWFSDSEDFKAMTEAAAGFEHTNYRDDTKDSNEILLIPKAYLEKKVFKNSRISQELILYPSLT
ncbi:MAG: hypothetical protein DRZ76_00285, partial [Candidatus Nealsonbacteria bacterium]